MPLPRSLARLNRVVTNRVLGPLAGWLPPFATVLHRGRSSGREYRTPVWTFRTGEGFVIALTYGANADWVRNVLTAGGCSLRRLGRLHDVTRPRLVVGRDGRSLMPGVLRPVLLLLRVREFLELEIRAP